MPPQRQNEPPEMAAIVAAYRLQADKDNAQLRMKEDEIQLLRTQLSVQSKTRTGSAAAKLSASGEQQAYAIGASMGQRRLTSSPPVALRELPSTPAWCCRASKMPFSGQLRSENRSVTKRCLTFAAGFPEPE
jgi:hypothetical protein